MFAEEMKAAMVSAFKAAGIGFLAYFVFISILFPANRTDDEEKTIFSSSSPTNDNLSLEILKYMDTTHGNEFKIRKLRTYEPKTYEKALKFPTAPLTTCQSEYWGVTTTINYPTIAIKQLLTEKKVCLVITGDKKSPKDFKLDQANGIYLDCKAQLNLTYNIIRVLPFSNFARKAIGYIYAIQHGAKYIYDFDDDNEFLNTDNIKDTVFGYDKFKYQMIKTDDIVHNVYDTYIKDKTPNIWPRGYPLTLIKDKKPFTKEDFTDFSRVKTIQYIQDLNPDLDAIFRITQDIPATFDPDQKNCYILPHKTYCPFNSQATYFGYESFWGLILPMTVNGRVSDIWRSYIIQAIFAKQGNYLAFCPAIVRHVRNQHSLIRDFNAEIPLYTQTLELLKFLNTIEFSSNPRQALIDIFIQLYEYGIIEAPDIEYLDLWLTDLDVVGYKFV